MGRALAAITHELGGLPRGGRARSVEVVLTDGQAARVRAQGVGLTERKARRSAAGDGVFRPYSGEGGIAEELRTIAREHPGLAKVESIGKTVKGRDILAVKVTKDANTTGDGTRPGALHLGAQHARDLRDNDRDGRIAPGDGVDLNRNFGYKWGWDNEGSSPDRVSETYRGPGPDSEPETKALNAFELRRAGAAVRGGLADRHAHP